AGDRLQPRLRRRALDASHSDRRTEARLRPLGGTVTLSSSTSTESRLAATALWVSTAARLVLGGVFLIAGGLKVIDPQSSVTAVRAYRLVATSLATLVGWGAAFCRGAPG